MSEKSRDKLAELAAQNHEPATSKQINYYKNLARVAKEKEMPVEELTGDETVAKLSALISGLLDVIDPETLYLFLTRPIHNT